MNTNPIAPAKCLKLYVNNKIHSIPELPKTLQDFRHQVILPLNTSLPSSWILRYKDDEGELITIFSENDYTDMLENREHNSSKSFKIFIVSLDSEDPDWKEMQQEISIISSTASEFEIIDGNSSCDDMFIIEEGLDYVEVNRRSHKNKIQRDSVIEEGKSEGEDEEEIPIEDFCSGLWSSKAATISGLSQISIQENQEDQEKEFWEVSFTDKLSEGI